MLDVDTILAADCGVDEVGSSLKRVGSSLSLLLVGLAVGFLVGLLRRRPDGRGPVRPQTDPTSGKDGR